MSDIVKATHQGKFDIGAIEINCANLEDGTRVISKSAIFKAFGRTKRGRIKGEIRVHNMPELPAFLDANNLQPFINEEFRSVLIPIDYLNLNGKHNTGYKAEILPMMCRIYMDARSANVLTKQQLPFASQSESVLYSLSQVGIAGLVDEATGYQEIRQRDALQQILDKYLRKEYAAWASCFPIEFYEEMFRLKGWHLDKKTMKMPQVVGRFTNDIIYNRLAPGVLGELQVKNPVLKTGRRKTKHHQWLTEDIGHPALDRHFSGVMALMRANANWEQFKRSLERAYPKLGDQLALRFDAPEDDD